MPRIDWNCPEPRSGFAGALDRLTGPGAEPAEVALQFGMALLAAVAAWFWYRSAAAGSAWMAGLAAFVAFDVAGGIVTNATSTAKRWFHRAGEGVADHFKFQALHLVHIAVVAFVFAGGDWLLFALLAATLLGCSVVILATPLYLKLLVSHLVPEEPYRPAAGGSPMREPADG
ncbi:MAG: hypothetical protein ACOCZB_05595 [Spirochaetota bacterium]